MERDRVVDRGRDAFLPKEFLQLIPSRDTDHELVVAVRTVSLDRKGDLLRVNEPGILKEPSIGRCGLPAALEPPIQVA